MTHTPTWITVDYERDYGRPAALAWRDINWTEHERDIDVDGTRVHYLDYRADEGRSERTFVLVHGLGGRWQHWSENIPALARHGCVIAVDLPGFGCSPRLRGRYSVDRLTDVVASVVQRLDLGEVIVLGHSLGGPLAVRFALRHRHLVQGIVLVAGTVQGFADALGMRNMGWNLRHRRATVVSTYFEVLTAGIPAPAWLRRLIIASPVLRQVMLWPYLRRPADLPGDSVELLVDGVGAPGVLPTARAVGALPLADWLVEAEVPTLVVGADHDPISPLSDLRAFLDSVGPVQAVVLEGTGHMLMLERPDAFNTEILRFIQTPGPTGTAR
ncbi:alpha/beta fold hydrolase [Nocardia asiatica]